MKARMTTRKANADAPILRVAVVRKSVSIMVVRRQPQQDIELAFMGPKQRVIIGLLLG